MCTFIAYGITELETSLAVAYFCDFCFTANNTKFKYRPNTCVLQFSEYVCLSDSADKVLVRPRLGVSCADPEGGQGDRTPTP